ncbi:MAG: MarR family transcriptional regulator [Spirochaetia bacterium]|nr:MarR family transcriptional regulator [Spirochaetia bacterium]
MARDIVTLDGAFAYYINRTHRSLRMDFLEMTKRAGYELTPEQYFILNKLFHNPAQSQSELASDLDDRANITRGLAILQRKKLVKRSRDPEDKRKFSVRLTPQGEGVLKQLNPIIELRRKVVYAGLGKKDLATLRRILGKIESNLAH